MDKLLRLRELREGRDLSREELAVAAKVPYGTIVRAEQGKAMPRAGALVKIADALDVSLDELFGREVRQPAVTPAKSAKIASGRKLNSPKQAA